MGTVNVVFGLTLLLFPYQFETPVYAAVLPYLSLYGVAFLLSGTALAFVQLRPALPAPLLQASHLAVLAPCLAWAVSVSIPGDGWQGVFYFCGLAPVAAFLPWSGPRLRSVDVGSFSFRVALALALAAALPLLLVTALVTREQEEHGRLEALTNQQTLAAALASDVSHYITAYRQVLVTLVGYPGLLDLPPEAQQAVLRSYWQAYPDAVAFTTFDAAGKDIARSDGQPLGDTDGREPFEEFRRTGAPPIAVAIGRSPQAAGLRALPAQQRRRRSSLGGGRHIAQVRARRRPAQPG